MKEQEGADCPRPASHRNRTEDAGVNMMLCTHQRTRPRLVLWMERWNDGMKKQVRGEYRECCTECGAVVTRKPETPVTSDEAVAALVSHLTLGEAARMAAHKHFLRQARKDTEGLGVPGHLPPD